VWVENNGITALQAAAQYGHHEVVLLLIKRGADVSRADALGRTPMHCASQYGHAGTVALLHTHGADVNAVDEDGLSPLHMAAQCVPSCCS
jgi:ankyrin repeat protein